MAPAHLDDEEEVPNADGLDVLGPAAIAELNFEYVAMAANEAKDRSRTQRRAPVAPVVPPLAPSLAPPLVPPNQLHKDFTTKGYRIFVNGKCMGKFSLLVAWDPPFMLRPLPLPGASRWSQW